MCGRYAAAWEPTKFHETFGVQPPLFESFNVAPMQDAPIVRELEGERDALMARWSLLPRWVDRPLDFKASAFNARAETLQEKASFKRPFKSERCLVPVSGYFEWRDKQPFYVHAEDDEPLALAGLWEHWEGHGQAITSFAVITTKPGETMKALHHRMPAVLPEGDYKAWLSPESQPDELETLLRPFENLAYYPVARKLGRVRENSAELLEPITL